MLFLFLFEVLIFCYFFSTLFQIKESFAEPPECHDLKILAETSCLQGSGRHVGCVCSTVLRRWCYLLAWFPHVSEQMGTEQWKAPVSGYSRCIFAVYFVPGNWTRGRWGSRFGGQKGAKLKLFQPLFFFNFIFPIMKVSSYNSILEFFFPLWLLVHTTVFEVFDNNIVWGC